MSVKTYPYDTAEFLDDDESIALYAEAVLEEGDPGMYRHAIDIVARASGFALLAKQAGIPRRQMFEALLYPDADKGRTIEAVLHATSARARPEAAE